MPIHVSFSSLVDQYSSEIFAYLYRILQDGEDAEDCLQETYLRALKAYPQLKHDTNLRAWLYKIATNQAFSQFKERKRINEKFSKPEYDNRSMNSGVEDGIEREQMLYAIKQAVDMLPEKQRASLLMRKYQQLSYDQIAEALNCSQQAVRANVYQALKKLRDQFIDEEMNYE
jgi:RNA polymerase sigma-70 factor, ECF subfamily